MPEEGEVAEPTAVSETPHGHAETPAAHATAPPATAGTAAALRFLPREHLAGRKHREHPERQGHPEHQQRQEDSKQQQKHRGNAEHRGGQGHPPSPRQSPTHAVPQIPPRAAAGGRVPLRAYARRRDAHPQGGLPWPRSTP